MSRSIKSAAMFLAGLCWLAFAVLTGFFLLQYLLTGAGMPVGFFSVSPITSLIGLVNVIGLSAAAFICFAVGTALCVHSLVPRTEKSPQHDSSNKLLSLDNQ